MPTKKASTTAAANRSKHKASTPSDDTLVALKLKVDEKTYVRLCTLRAKERSTTQEILNKALQEHLKRLGG